MDEKEREPLGYAPPPPQDVRMAGALQATMIMTGVITAICFYLAWLGSDVGQAIGMSFGVTFGIGTGVLAYMVIRRR